MARKQRPPTSTQLGLQHVMNSPAKPTTKEGLEAYREMAKASGMNTKDMLSYIGKKAHMPRSSEGEKKKQDARLEKLQSSE